MISSSKFRFPRPGSVVGTIPSPNALIAARKLRPGAVDFFELRVDAFAALSDAGSQLDRLEAAASKLTAPLIVTARHPREGGAGNLSTADRSALLLRFMEHGALIDIELRAVTQLASAIKRARELGIGVIFSHHNFNATPSLKALRGLAACARKAGCDVFKVATLTRSPRDLTVLLEFLTGIRGFGATKSGDATQQPCLAVMGMGPYGPISRLTLGIAGSVLNYGYLDQVQVPGQWPARVLKERLQELSELPGFATQRPEI